MTNPSRSKRPYLIRAMHEWMDDNGHTPHIVVDTSFDGVAVPQEHIKDGKIILNISETAAHNLKLTHDAVSFRARFGGVPFDVWAPIRSVLGIMCLLSQICTNYKHNVRSSPVSICLSPWPNYAFRLDA